MAGLYGGTNFGGCETLGGSGGALNPKVPLFRWFKFTLKPPYTVASENLLWLIWDTSHWNSFLKFGLRTAYDMS